MTGAARRIGRAIALAYAEQGASVAITYRGSKDEAIATVRDLEACGVKAVAIQCDLSEELSVQHAVAEAVAYLGSSGYAGEQCGSLCFSSA